ncbi:malto-oligosyltrehalose synthase [Mycolicibacterium hodleri]|uniref:Malto-oligosyltrehalose synthase n=1 Tax=Mycolicibacterium hodleri TaxID=49897 RepID=A0A502E4J4_9MYCO|nr:malto-oligosyltrehalose synthase [Mycolicibacterium hodleri]TPG32244.1 malto-oligosyltrehalose synthase [Mycolicibacterium hodleri]
MKVLSTYRLQMRGPASGQAFTFTDAMNQLDYLHELGVSHVYLSPILTAGKGSTHGYDVTDPTTVSDELGGADGLAALAEAARSRNIGLIVDIVPNHVGVDDPTQNAWWWDVLAHGKKSVYSAYFDVDWSLDPGNRIVLPVLGDDGDVDDLVVDGDVLRLGERTWPIAPGTGDGSAAEVHERQHYALIGWRHNVCGYRRFFSITSLAALRQEDRAVFDATHVEVKRWFTEGLVDGLRIDHPDGLSDPAGYLEWLRELTGPDAWIVVEKILAPDETLEPSLPVAGTTGYDALRDIGGVLVDPAGAGEAESLESAIRVLKIMTATETLGSELARVRRAIVGAVGADHPRLPDAVAALLSHIGVYRSDYRGLAAVMPTALAETAAVEPDLCDALTLVAAALEHVEPATRIQQLCGAVTAKSVEDCLFYRDARLVSLNEVGGEPERFGVTLAEFHHSTAVRARYWPSAMVTLSTHDTKRSEDVRARIGVLSQVPALWTELLSSWTLATPPPDAATGSFLWQNAFGVWPVDRAVSDDLRGRLHAYAEKAIREAALHTSWNDPDEEFEAAVHRWLDDVIDGPVGVEMGSLVTQLDPHAQSDSQVQKLLSLTVPGIPDIYQGTELWDDSLVDPDNRRPVDYQVRRAQLKTLTDGKIRIVTAALHSRADRPDSYLSGGYSPVLADGAGARHLVAFRRGDDVLVAVQRWTVTLTETGWGDTTLPLPDGEWVDRLTGRSFTGRVPAAELFGDLPATLLERTLA